MEKNILRRLVDAGWETELASACAPRLLPILERAAVCDARPCIIALDGPAASGKTPV